MADFWNSCYLHFECNITDNMMNDSQWKRWFTDWDPKTFVFFQSFRVGTNGISSVKIQNVKAFTIANSAGSHIEESWRKLLADSQENIIECLALRLVVGHSICRLDIKCFRPRFAVRVANDACFCRLDVDCFFCWGKSIIVKWIKTLWNKFLRQIQRDDANINTLDIADNTELAVHKTRIDILIDEDSATISYKKHW